MSTTQPATGRKSTAVVLGGGGSVGIGWQTGLLTGLAEAGYDLSGADRVIGTSAGSLVGAFLASGADPAEALTPIAGLSAAMSGDEMRDAGGELLDAMGKAGLDDNPDAALRSIGRLANEHATRIGEDSLVGLLAALSGREWPAAFRCTAIDTESGEQALWGPDSGVELARGVASSCAAPVLLPTVTIGGRRYMDGGVHSHLNASAAAGADRVVALSCFPFDPPPGGMHEGFAAAVAVVRRELADLAAAGTAVVAVEPSPELLALGAGGTGMMGGPALAEQARDLGREQAGEVGGRLAALLTR
ncbi:patatin-like phospholipase family protein [Streptomonospora sediminis]